MQGEQLGDVRTKDYLATVYDPVPCVWSFKTPYPSYGTIALTSLDSFPYAFHYPLLPKPDLLKLPPTGW